MIAGVRRPALVVGAVLAACAREGSDVGPALDGIPDATCKILVLDDANRGVCGARVTVAGATAITGRSGRADLLAEPRGRLAFVVEGAAASAVAADRLPTLSFADDLPGPQLPRAVHLPDTSPSAGLPLFAGITFLGVALDDTGTSGASIAIAPGTNVSSLTPTFTLRTGRLAVEHLPGILPTAASGALVFSRGIWVDPDSFALLPGGDLEIPDDLGLPPGGTASTWWLDPFTDGGRWTRLDGDAGVVGGRLRKAGAVRTGGLYAFAVEVPTLATVRGRVVDVAGLALPCALVHCGEQRVEVGDDGRFAFALGATLGDGTARTVQFDLHGGRCHRPVSTTRPLTLPVTGGVLDLGDVALDTLPAGNLRMQAVASGRADAQRRIGISSVDGNVALVATTDTRGQCLFEDLPQGWFGFTDGRPIDRDRVYLALSAGIQDFGRRWTDIDHFLLETYWFVGSRNSRTFAVDWRGGGPVRDAAIVKGNRPGEGFVDSTEEGGLVINNRPFDGRATASVRTTGEGRTVTSAFTIVDPNGEHLEMPLRRADLRSPGAFDRHGVLAGSLTGVTAAVGLAVRSTRPLEATDWFDDVFFGVSPGSDLPVAVAPTSVNNGAFEVGVAVPVGQVAATQGGYALQRVGVMRQLSLAEAGITARNLALTHAVDTTFTAPGAWTNAHPALAPADLTFALALQTGDGLVTDVARGVGGNHVVIGDDVRFALPALDGDFAGAAWLVAATARKVVGDTTIAQHALHRFAATGSTVNVPLLPVPEVTEPAPGATVPASGFDVRWFTPDGTHYMTIELVFEDATTTAHWQVVMPPSYQQFSFVRLPPEAPSPLVAGRTYTLSVTAWRIDDGPLAAEPERFRSLTTYWVSIGAAERRVTAIASRSFQITTN